MPQTCYVYCAVVLVGEETTGKTTIYRTLLHEQLDEKYKPSIGPPKQGTIAKTNATNDVDVALFDTGTTPRLHSSRSHLPPQKADSSATVRSPLGFPSCCSIALQLSHYQ